MLTADEQWRIIQQEERRTGRGRRKKKKSFMEQLEDMGGFGYDPDSEQAIREDLERTDTRSPMQYSKESISECEVSFGESSFWESRKRLFNSWVFQANRSSSWMEKKDLPLFFRFALRRPIMDERSFQATLHAMNMQLEIAMGDVRQPNTQPIGRFRELIFGIDVDHKTDIHVSSKFRHILPKGGAENMDKVKEGVTKMSEQDDEDKQQLVRRQLWAVYEHVQNSSVPLETAIWHYRDVFSTPDMSDETLIVCLQQFGIPTDHIPTNERNARRGSAHCPFSSGLESFREEIANNAVPNEKERRIIKELVNYIGLYRGGALQEHEVIPMIQHGLDGLGLEANVISDILTDFDKDEEAAALLMWEDACYNIDTTSSEEESEGSHEEQEKPLRAIFIPHPHVNEGKDHEAAVAPHVDGSKLHDGPATEDLNYQDDFKENGPEQSEAMSIDRPLMSPPAIPRGKRLTSSHVNDAESSIQPPGTPRPKPASPAPATEDFGSRSDVEFDREPPRDRANAGGRRLSSPENGMTTGIWGLLMPTREARELAYRMKLPQDTIDQQVRSILPRRTKSRRASYAKTVVIFPKSKCKASTVLHGANPPKSPKHGDHSDLFATEGEDQETFVLSHFDRYSIHSEDTCMRCLRLLCECVHGSSPHLRSEPECPECLRQPCICSHLPQPDEAIPVVPSNGNPSFGVPMAESADRTRRKPLKQSITLLAYLTRVLDNDDVLASIKHLERLSPADRTVADAKAILDHTYQGIYAGEELDITGNDDREAVRILDALVQSSQTLTDYSHELHSDQKGENDSITSVDGCHDEVGEGPDLGSSLLNSSPGHEKISAPRSNSVASATDFPKSQSNVANGSVFRANSTPLAEELSSYLPTPPPDSSFPPLEFSSDIEDVVQPSHFQASIFSDSSARGDPSRAENYSDAQAGGESSTARGHPSGAELQNPPSSTADLNEQVSEHPVGTEVDTDCDTLGAPLTGQPNSGLWGTGNSGVETRPPPSPRPGAKQFPSSIPLPSSRPPLKGFPKSTPPATPSLGSKVSKTMNAIAKTCLESPGFDSLPLWPAQPGLPEKGGMEWMSMTPKQALEHAKEEAFNQRKSLAFYLEERRAVRNRIKKENNFANSKWSDYSFFQSSHGLSGSSGTAIVPALNKLFDKYRGTSES